MPNNNKRKDLLLGMSHGTAASRLRKNILFSLVCDFGLNVCYKCESAIETADEFSIEHKEPWQRAQDPRKSFFDLENIAFSHLSCNVSEHEQRKPDIKIGPDGTSWCYGHNEFVPNSEFHANKDHWSGVNRFCKICKAERYPDTRKSHARKT